MRSFMLALLMLIAAATARAQETVKIGAFVTLSGVSADVGGQMRAGIEVAVERIGKAYAIAGKPAKIEVIWYDDEGKADTGLNVVTRALTVDRITIGIGFLSSDVFIRVMDEFQKASTPVIACCAASLKLGDKIADQKMKYVFQLSPTARDIATATIGAAGTLVPTTKIALLNENTDSGRDFSRISREWLAANAPKIEVVADDFVPRGVSDLTAQLAKFKRLGAGAIVGEVYGTSAPIYYQQFNELRVRGRHLPHGHQRVRRQLRGRARQGDGGVAGEHTLAAGRLHAGDEADGGRLQGAHPGSRRRRLPCRPMTRRWWRWRRWPTPAARRRTRSRRRWRTATSSLPGGRRRFTSLAEGHRMPVATIIAQIQDGRKVVVYPVDVAAKLGGAYRAVPPYSWQK